jgi:hypothetical protein
MMIDATFPEGAVNKDEHLFISLQLAAFSYQLNELIQEDIQMEKVEHFWL